MPNFHDGQDPSPSTPPVGDLSYSRGSRCELLPGIRQTRADGPSRRLPVRLPVPRSLVDLDAARKPSLRASALHVVVGAAVGEGVRADDRPLAWPGSGGADKWQRLGRSVWGANRDAMAACASDIPQWLTGDVSADREFTDMVSDDEQLPLRYGIQIDAASRGPLAVVHMNPRMTSVHAPTNPLLQFPPSLYSTIRRGRVPAIVFADGVLPFHSPARQTTTVFSLVGGTGATSIAAGLARVAAGSGLRALLADACAHSLLSRLFGASEFRQGVVRNFFPASGEKNRMISLVNLAIDPFTGDDLEQYRILGEFEQDASKMDRIIWDLSGAPLDWAAKVLSTSPQILVPLLPNTNSLVQLRATQRFLNRCHEEDPASRLRYVLNHFDEGNPLHVDMHDRFRQLLGHQMLQVTLRRSPLMDEALAHSRTIIDYAPESLLVNDLRGLARQLNQTQPAALVETPASTPSEWFEQ